MRQTDYEVLIETSVVSLRETEKDDLNYCYILDRILALASCLEVKVSLEHYPFVVFQVQQLVSTDRQFKEFIESI